MKFWAADLAPVGAGVPALANKSQAISQFEDSIEGVKTMLKDALDRNKGMHKTIVLVNLVMVGIGVFFILASIIYSIINMTIDQITLSSAGLALADFVAIFFVNPQQRLKVSLANFVQLGLICHSWSSRTQASFLLFIKSPQSKVDVDDFQAAISQTTADSVKEIEERVEKDAK
jgi:hypothetical protein